MLTDVANKEEPYKWIDKKLITALIEVKPIIIITLQNQLNPKLDTLAVVLQILIYSP